MFKSPSCNSGFTLIEVLIATSIFSMIMIMVAQFYGNTFAGSRRAQAELQLYQSSRNAISLLADEMGHSTIDYQKYWERNEESSVAGFTAENTIKTCDNPLQSIPPTPNPNGVAALFIAKNYRFQCIDSEKNATVGLKNGRLDCSKDSDYDDNPAYGQCPDAIEAGKASLWNSTIGNKWNGSASGSILFLVDESGEERTWFRKNNNNQLEILRLHGYDTDNDDVRETWICEKNFECNGSVSDGTLTTGKKPTTIDDGWLAITPATLSITTFDFIISPTKDPYKAFRNDNAQLQPHILLYFSAQPSDTILQKIGVKTPVTAGQNPPPPQISLQTTITARVVNDLTVFDQ